MSKPDFIDQEDGSVVMVNSDGSVVFLPQPEKGISNA